jgi:hypothetical protein
MGEVGPEAVISCQRQLVSINPMTGPR